VLSGELNPAFVLNSPDAVNPVNHNDSAGFISFDGPQNEFEAAE
jgi:hypothetical protein